jgi:hypothetical protein
MPRKRCRTAVPALATAALLVLGAWLFCRLLPPWSASGPTGAPCPRLVLHALKRDLGSVDQGRVLRATFPVTNAGGRRLLILEEGGGCCGQPAEARRLIVPPGERESLAVEVDTAPWHGRMDHVVYYTTNDPELPRFALQVTAQVRATTP